MTFNIQSTPLNNIVIPDATPIRTIGKNDLRWRRSVSELYEWIGLASMQSERYAIHVILSFYLAACSLFHHIAYHFYWY